MWHKIDKNGRGKIICQKSNMVWKKKKLENFKRKTETNVFGFKRTKK